MKIHENNLYMILLILNMLCFYSLISSHKVKEGKKIE